LFEKRTAAIMSEPNGSLATIASYTEEISRRNVRFSDPVVLTLESGRPRQPAGGYIFIAAAVQGSAVLQGIVEAVRSRNYSEFARLARANPFVSLAGAANNASGYESPETVLGELGKFSHVLHEHGIEGALGANTMAAVPVFGEIRYRTRTLTSGLFAYPPVVVNSVWLPYNGGTLDLKAFKLVEYFINEADPRLEAVVVIREPTLSALEKEILARVPVEKSEIHIGDGVAPLFWAHVAEAIAVQVVIHVTKAIANWVTQHVQSPPGPPPPPPPPTPQVMSERLSQDLSQLSPEIAARQLLEIRSQRFLT
jgi:hypothetical protein